MTFGPINLDAAKVHRIVEWTPYIPGVLKIDKYNTRIVENATQVLHGSHLRAAVGKVGAKDFSRNCRKSLTFNGGPNTNLQKEPFHFPSSVTAAAFSFCWHRRLRLRVHHPTGRLLDIHRASQWPHRQALAKDRRVVVCRGCHALRGYFGGSIPLLQIPGEPTCTYPCCNGVPLLQTVCQSSFSSMYCSYCFTFTHSTHLHFGTFLFAKFPRCI